MYRILFLDNSVENDTYEAPGYWKPLLMYSFDFFRISAGEWPADLGAYSHILITGSSASVLDDTDWMKQEVALIRSAVDKGKVMLGSCFGHQIIARALFGLETVRRRKTPEIGWPDIEILVDDPLLGNAGRKINSFVFHYDEVCNLPDNQAKIVARSKACKVLGFRIIDKPVWGIQPHFEIGIVEGLNYLDKVSGENIPKKRSFFVSDQHPPKDSGWIVQLMKAFHNASPMD